MLGATLAFLLISTAHGQYDAPIHNQTQAFSQFDLFKNAHLHPCPNKTLSSFLKPKPGEFSTANITVSAGAISSQNGFCYRSQGYLVMLPTIPTPAAFFTWWPSLVVQAVGWIATLMSTFTTSKSFKAGRDMDMKLPKTFWVVLPFDTARVLVWWYKLIKGIRNTRQLPFISPLSWVIPLNYAILVTLIGQRRNYHPRIEEFPLTPQAQEAGVVKSTVTSGTTGVFEDYRPYQIQPSEVYHDGESIKEDELRPRPGMHPSLRKSRPVIFLTSLIILGLAFIQWGLTIGVITIHWRTIWTSDLSKRLQQYTLHPLALKDPTTLGPDLPTDCLNWFREAHLEEPALGIFTVQRDQLVMSLVPTVQFTVASLFLLSMRSIIKDPFKRALNMTGFVFGASMMNLIITGMALGMDAAINRLARLKRTQVSYVTVGDVYNTGGCTFGWVDIDVRYGGWDVQYDLRWRIASSIFGAG